MAELESTVLARKRPDRVPAGKEAGVTATAPGSMSDESRHVHLAMVGRLLTACIAIDRVGS